MPLLSDSGLYKHEATEPQAPLLHARLFKIRKTEHHDAMSTEDPFNSSEQSLEEEIKPETAQGLKPEKANVPEASDRNGLVELRNKAIELLRRDREQGNEVAEEVQDALMAWRLAAEERIGELNPQEPYGAWQVRSAMEEATVLRDARRYQEAFDTLFYAQTQAKAQNRRDLFDAAGDMMDEINRME